MYDTEEVKGVISDAEFSQSSKTFLRDNLNAFLNFFRFTPLIKVSTELLK